MDRVQEAYERLGLTEEASERLTSLTSLGVPRDQANRRFVVETVIIEDGQRTVIHREEHSGQLV